MARPPDRQASEVGQGHRGLPEQRVNQPLLQTDNRVVGDLQPEERSQAQHILKDLYNLI